VQYCSLIWKTIYQHLLCLCAEWFDQMVQQSPGREWFDLADIQDALWLRRRRNRCINIERFAYAEMTVRLPSTES
jgi:hypothetical protein